jgi:prephenate dehydratase
MKLFLTWLIGVPLVIASMVLVRMNTDAVGSTAGAVALVGESRQIVAAAIASMR